MFSFIVYIIIINIATNILKEFTHLQINRSVPAQSECIIDSINCIFSIPHKLYY